MRKITTIVRDLLFFSLLISTNLAAGEIQSNNKQSRIDIRWQDVDGEIHHLKDSKGKIRLLHFWAAWCIPCRGELPDMLSWQKKNSDILIIPLSLDERIAQTSYFIDKYKLDMPALLIDEDDAETLDIPGLPFTIFISADGSFSGYYYGAAPWQDIKFSEQIRQHFKSN